MRKKRFLYSLARVICTPLFKLLYRYRYTNKDNIPQSGAYIICSNHISYSDPLLLGIGQKREIRYMAKSELFATAFLPGSLRAWVHFPCSAARMTMRSLTRPIQSWRMGRFWESSRRAHVQKQGNCCACAPARR